MCSRVKNWRHGQCRCSGQQFLPDETKPSISRRPSATTPRSLLSPAKTYLEAELTSEDKFWVIAASTPEELLAAATLRAQIFYSYPQVDMTLAGIEAVGARVANDLIIDDLLRTRRKSEFTRESKFEALGMRVKCLLAVCRQSSVESIGGGVATSCLLAPPPVPSIDSSSTGALVAIGTLDVQEPRPLQMSTLSPSSSMLWHIEPSNGRIGWVSKLAISWLATPSLLPKPEYTLRPFRAVVIQIESLHDLQCPRLTHLVAARLL